MKKNYLPIFILLLADLTIAQTKRIYVNPAAFGQQNGSSWTDAYTNLHDALAIAEAGDEIWTARGQYRASEAGDRSAHFILPSGVGLYGGFAATEMTLDERDIAANPSILDGDIGTPNDSTDNSYNLLYMDNPDSNTVVDGFTFQNALANQAGVYNGTVGVSGAALYIMAANGAAYPYIRNCIFEYNTAEKDGGAVYINGNGTGSVAPVFEHCMFSNNASLSGSGGGLCRFGGSWIERKKDINYCIFEKNRAFRKGGGVFFVDTERIDNYDIANSVFTSNIIATSTGILKGLAIHISAPRYLGTSIISFKNTGFENHNYLSGTGSDGISVIGFDNDFSPDGHIIIRADSCFMRNNLISLFEGEVYGSIGIEFDHTVIEKSGKGGKTFSLGASEKCSIKNTIVKNCGSFGLDFRFLLYTKNVYIENLQWLNNFSNTFSSIGVLAPGEQINIVASNIIVAGNKFLINENEGLVIGGSVISTNSSFSNISTYNNRFYGGVKGQQTYTNCLFGSSNPAHIQKRQFNQSLTYDHCIFSLPDTFSNLGWIQHNNQWSTNPMFVAPDSGDFRLSACSPAINAGTNNGITAQKDIFGNPRIQFGTVDIGAVEAGDPVFYTPPVIEASCIGGSSGTADLSSLDICSPAQYQWSNGPVSDQPKQTDLEPGVYTVTVTDTKGRSLSLSIEIPEAPSLDLQAISLPVVCGDTLGGSAAVQISGNPGPFVYDWGFSADSIVQHLSAGVYSVTVTDAHRCSATTSVEVKRAGSLQLTFVFDPISCFGADDASLSVIPANGKSPFTWLWNDGFEGPTRAPVGPGAYGGNLTDAFGCNTQWYVPITEPAPLHLTGFVNPATGPQTPDGIILLDSLTGGKSPYTVIWNTGQSGLNLTELLPGNYTATMTDQNGCTLVKTFTVSFESGTATPLTNAGAYQIYPNPSPGALFLVGPGFGEMQFSLKDDAGKTVFKQTFEAGKGAMFNRTFEPVALPAGAYHWSLVCGSGRFGGIWVKGR